MTIFPTMDRDPTSMTRSARIYLMWIVFRQLTTGAFMVLQADQFVNAQFLPVINFLTIPTWGVCSIAVAFMASMAAILRNRMVARLSLISSAVVTALLCSGLWIGAITIWSAGGKTTPILAIALTAIIGKDLSVCTDPLRTPFELTETARKVLRGDGRRK